MATKNQEFDAEDVADLLHKQDPKNHQYVAVLHGHKAGTDVSFFTSPDSAGIVNRITELFKEEFEYNWELSFYLENKRLFPN
jgi:hypothetical protein